MIKTRIAPTPSGFLHLGNVYSFVLTWLITKKQNGSILLRIDDLDTERTRPEYLEDIFQMLDFIGIQPNEGPSGIAEFHEKYSQKRRMPYYFKNLQKLIDQNQVFACQCSRKTVTQLSPNGRYPGTCLTRKLPILESHLAVRVKVDNHTQTCFFDEYLEQTRTFDIDAQLGSFVVWRKDGIPAYHLASVTDDLLFGINVIVRGEDLALSTAAQLYLAGLLGKNSFNQIKWFHHPLQRNQKGEKLSKSSGSKAVSGLRAMGLSKSVLLQHIASLLLLPTKPYNTLEDLLDFF